MKIEVLEETSRTAGVATYRVIKTIEGIDMIARRTKVTDGTQAHQGIVYTLTTTGKLEVGNRVRIPEIVRTRGGSVKKAFHYSILFDLTGTARLGRYEMQRVPA